MKTRNRIIIGFIALSLGSSLFLSGMGNRDHRWDSKKMQEHRENMHQHMIDQLSKELDLSADQRTKVEAIVKASQEKMKALREEMRPKMEAIHQSIKSDIEKILTPAQKEKFEKMEAKWKSHHERHDDK